MIDLTTRQDWYKTYTIFLSYSVEYSSQNYRKQLECQIKPCEYWSSQNAVCGCLCVFLLRGREISSETPLQLSAQSVHFKSNCNSHKVEWQIFNMEFGMHRVEVTGGSRVGIKSDTAGDYFIILIWPSLWAVPRHPAFAGMGTPHTHTHTHTHRGMSTTPHCPRAQA